MPGAPSSYKTSAYAVPSVWNAVPCLFCEYILNYSSPVPMVWVQRLYCFSQNCPIRAPHCYGEVCVSVQLLAWSCQGWRVTLLPFALSQHSAWTQYELNEEQGRRGPGGSENTEKRARQSGPNRCHLGAANSRGPLFCPARAWG